MAYRAVARAELERSSQKKVPDIFGITAVCPITAGTLAQRAGGLEFRCAEYSDDDHSSIGLAAGRYPLDDLAQYRSAKGGWTGQRFLASPQMQRDIQPWDGAYEVVVVIDAALAATVQAQEQQHLDDYRYSWTLSHGALRVAAAAVPHGTDLHPALDHLVSHLTEHRQTYLVPEHPYDLAAWGARASTVYARLCDQSTKRDQRGDHSSARYEVQLERRTAPTPHLMTVRPVGKALVGAAPADVIDPAEIEIVHASAAVHQLALGMVVTWKAVPGGRAPNTSIYPSVAADASLWDDNRVVIKAVTAGLPVAAMSETTAWLEVDLTIPTLKQQFNNACDPNWTKAYLQVPIPNLRPRPV